MAKIDFKGGLNENDDADIRECVSGKNFELQTQDAALHRRPTLDLKDTTAATETINGIMQLIDRDDNDTTLVFEGGGTPTIFEWDGTTFTSKRTLNLNTASKLRDNYWSLDDFISISDISLLTPMLKWDGTDCTRLKTGLVSGSTQANVSITETAGDYQVNIVGHGYNSGDLVTIAGAIPTGLNGEWEITRDDADNFTFTTTAGIGNSSTHGTSQIGTELFAKYSITHNNRLWLFNVTADSTELPHMLVASAFEDPENYDITQRAASGAPSPTVAFFILSPDLRPINGVTLINKQLVISTLGGRLYRLVGFDTTNYEFVQYYAGSQAIGDESVASIGNDVVYMREGGNIESLLMTDTSGDVAANDLSRWIKDTVKDLTGALTCYDQSNQKVHFFVENKVLVLFKDILFSNETLSPWSVYETELTFDFNTNAAKYLRRPGETTYSVYIGDDVGNIYDMNGTGVLGDADTSDIVTQRVTRLIDEISYKEDWLFGRIRYRRKGECDITISFDWANEYNVSESTITLKGPAAGSIAPVYGVLDPADPAAIGYGTGADAVFYGANFDEKISHQSFSPTGKAEAMTMTVFLETGVDFQVDLIDLQNVDFVIRESA